MKKFLVALLVAALSLSLFAFIGCAQGDPNTIKVSVWDNDIIPRYGKLIEGFEKEYPQYKVELINSPSSDYGTKLTTMLNGNSDMDVYYVKDADTLPGFYSRGQTEDLTKYASEDLVKSFGGKDKDLTFDGKLAALPESTSYYVMFYNKTLFNKVSKAFPTNDMTWAEWEQLAMEMTSGTGATKTYGAHLHTWNAIVQNWGAQTGEMSILEPDKYVDYYTDAYEMALRLDKGGYVQSYSTVKTSKLHYSNAFMQGNIAMMPMGNWFVTTLLDKKKAGEFDFDWGIATIPAFTKANSGATVGATTPLVMNSKSTKKDIAWKFMEYVCSAKGGAVNSAAGQLPAVITDDTLKAFANMPGMPEPTAATVSALKVKTLHRDRPIHEKSASVDKAIAKVHDLIMLGESIGAGKIYADLTAALNDMAAQARIAMNS